MTLSVVIPNYNGSVLLRENLPKILTAVGRAEIIVVDDASTDDSLSVLKKNFPEVEVIKRTKNEGFSSAVNAGVTRTSGDLILLLNSDAVPEDNFLQFLLPHFEDTQVFAVGCLQKIRQGKDINRQGRGTAKFEKGFLLHGPGSLDKTNTLWVSAGAAIYRKNIWQKLGGLNTIYDPFYWEDIDLSYRALKAGYGLVFEPQSKVLHRQETGAIRNLYTPDQIKTISLRNQILFVWSNITDQFLLLNHFLYLSYYLLKAVFTLNFIFLKAFFSAVLKFGDVLSSRTRNKKLDKISDKKILSDVSS